MPALLAFAPLPGLAAALLAQDAPPLVFDPQRLQLTLALDAPSALLLGVAAFLWLTAGAYASTYLRADPHRERFAVCWLLTLTGSLGVFLAGDLATFYVLFALVSLAAYGLVVQDGTPKARQAGVIYLALAVIGEIFLLAGFVLLAAASPGDSLAIRAVTAALPGSPWLTATIVCLLAGFGLKAGLVPLHVWLPIAHPAAPMPASAVLSGAIIKAGIIGLIAFLPLATALPGWGAALTALGLVTAFYGVAIGITQPNPKTILAYSSVSQMGVVAAVLGMSWSVGDAGGAMPAAQYAAHHVLAKGALFLAVGIVASAGGARVWLVLAVAAVLALGMGGLPLTGGALAKLTVKPLLGDGLVATLASLSGAGTTLLMLHFLGRLVATRTGKGTAPPAGLMLPWLVTAIAAVAVPWLLYPTADALAPAVLWDSAWPVLLGTVLAVALHLWGHQLPRVPRRRPRRPLPRRDAPARRLRRPAGAPRGRPAPLARGRRAVAGADAGFGRGVPRWLTSVRRLVALQREKQAQPRDHGTHPDAQPQHVALAAPGDHLLEEHHRQHHDHHRRELALEVGDAIDLQPARQWHARVDEQRVQAHGDDLQHGREQHQIDQLDAAQDQVAAGRHGWLRGQHRGNHLPGLQDAVAEQQDRRDQQRQDADEQHQPHAAQQPDDQPGRGAEHGAGLGRGGAGHVGSPSAGALPPL